MLKAEMCLGPIRATGRWFKGQLLKLTIKKKTLVSGIALRHVYDFGFRAVNWEISGCPLMTCAVALYGACRNTYLSLGHVQWYFRLISFHYREPWRNQDNHLRSEWPAHEYPQIFSIQYSNYSNCISFLSKHNEASLKDICSDVQANNQITTE